MTIKLEEGKYYETRDGRIVGPMLPVSAVRRAAGYAFAVKDLPEWRGNNDDIDWTVDGRFRVKATFPSCEDLVEEVPAPAQEPPKTLKIEEGKYYKTRDGSVVGPLSRENAGPYAWRGADAAQSWTERGSYWISENQVSRLDLVEEVPAPTAHQLTTDDLVADGYEIVKETFKRAEEKRISKADLLDKAKEAVADRGLNYGKPEDNFARIAAFWNVYLRSAGVVDRDVFGPADVAQMMVLMKMARIQNQPDHLDSWIDIAGYAACGAEISCGP